MPFLPPPHLDIEHATSGPEEEEENIWGLFRVDDGWSLIIGREFVGLGSTSFFWGICSGAAAQLSLILGTRSLLDY
jgi:hypothetical protein